MQTFEITIGQSQRRLRLEPQEEPKRFKIYAADPSEDWIDHGQARAADLPIDGYLGTIQVESKTRFDFNGSAAFTGIELESIAVQLAEQQNPQLINK